jgi:hypothetical protein
MHRVTKVILGILGGLLLLCLVGVVVFYPLR